MLSRIAEAMFWIGRYVERAEVTTRLLVEHHQLLVQDTRLDPTIGAQALLGPLGLMPADGPDGSDSGAHGQRPDSRLTPARLVDLVLGDASGPSTIRGSVASARENARTIREVLAEDMFERLNATHLRLQAGVSTVIPGIPLRGLLDELAVVNGIVEWQMPRDEGLVFLRLGAALERLDMTSRILEIDHERLWPQAGAATTLRAAGGLNPFLRTQRALSGEQVRAFLVLDPTFPRSMLGSAVRSERMVRQMGQYVSSRQTSTLLRTVGILRAELEFASVNPTPADLELLSERGRDAAFEASDAVAVAFFRQAGTIVWSH
ncbi:MAG: alpha-E domain-containing protein [Candidatus Nanopelagicales bacterium]